MGKISNFIVVATLASAISVGGSYLEKPFKPENVGNVVERLHKDSLESKVSNGPSSVDENSQTFSAKEYLEIQKILYAEAANQSSKNRSLITRCILNRVPSEDYPNDIYSVIHERNAFSCTFDGSKLWGQAEEKLSMNEYEQKVFEKCGKDAKKVLDGFKVGISRGSEIIAYHDISIEKPSGSYWSSLEKVYESERLIFYAPKLV